jgi:hypothetical protein
VTFVKPNDLTQCLSSSREEYVAAKLQPITTRLTYFSCDILTPDRHVYIYIRHRNQLTASGVPTKPILPQHTSASHSNDIFDFGNVFAVKCCIYEQIVEGPFILSVLTHA